MTSAARKVAAICAVLGLATVGLTATTKPANAWWRSYPWGVGVFVPPVVVAPPPPPPAYYAPPGYSYYAPPAYYPPPGRVWIPAHWQGNYWVPGHWS
jgi:hypothetical protein